MTPPLFYHYWRSSSSWRVRWALRLKGVDFQPVAVDLLAGEQRSAAHHQRNPADRVPVLQVGDQLIAESVAICEYLEEVYPQPPLLPREPLARARARQLVELINAGTQPLQNLTVLRAVSDDPAAQRAWAARFIRAGLSVYEELLTADGRPLESVSYSVGDAVTLADLFLVPQCYNARRQGLDVAEWPRIARIEAACLATPAARETSPQHLNPSA